MVILELVTIKMNLFKLYKSYAKWSLQFFKKYWRFQLLLPTIVVIIFVIVLISSLVQTETTMKRFPYLEAKMHMKGKIEFIDTSSFRGEGVRLKFENGSGRSVGPAINNQHNPSKLRDFLQIGDSLIKNSGTDSLFIYRNGQSFVFLLNKEIN